jgi:integrase
MGYLTETRIKASKAGEKPIKAADGGGLYLQVNPNGSKLWRYRYKFEGKAKLMALGSYPDVSLAQARERHVEARKMLASKVDPMAERKAEKLAEAGALTFAVVAAQWHEWWKANKAPDHAAQVLRRVDADLIPAFGSLAMDEITPVHVTKMMQRIADRGAMDVARRAHSMTSQIFGFAVTRGLAKMNPASQFKPSLVVIKPEAVNFARVSTKEIPKLLAAMDSYNGTMVTKLAMRLLALTFVRTSELIEAKWSEFDLEAARWDIPKERMKKRRPHLVPLAPQAVEILKVLKMGTGNNVRLGYKGVMTGHGYRGIASTVLYESKKFHRDWIELQLAHVKKDKVEAAYNWADFLQERTDMMAWWANYLDAQRLKA